MRLQAGVAPAGPWSRWHGEIVTLCGSMRFFPLMLAEAAELTGSGVIVLAPFQIVPVDEQASQAKAELDELHRRKIDLADRIVVVTDESRYIGDSTRSEIRYATLTGTPVSWAVRVVSAGVAR